MQVIDKSSLSPFPSCTHLLGPLLPFLGSLDLNRFLSTSGSQTRVSFIVLLVPALNGSFESDFCFCGLQVGTKNKRKEFRLGSVT